MKSVLITSLLILSVTMFSCEKEVKAPEKGISEFVVYVSNQSLEQSSVNVVVSVDGTEYINDSFEVLDQNTWTKYNITLKKGSHTIALKSSNGEAAFSGSFDLEGEKHYGVINYNYDSSSPIIPPRYFTFEMHSGPAKR